MTLVLGGGISGLSAAYYALRNPNVSPVVLLEASDRLGGWIRSKKLPNGVIFEQGPRILRPQGLAGKTTLNLIEDLQLSDQIIPIKAGHPAVKTNLIYINEELHSLREILNTKTIIRTLWREFKIPKTLKDDESVYSFIERRFGKQFADNIVSPLICGIYAGDAHQISVKCAPTKDAFELEQRYGSVTKGLITKWFKLLLRIKNSSSEENINLMKQVEDGHYRLSEISEQEKWAVWGLKGGFEQLPLTLAKNLRTHGVDIRINNSCERLNFKNNYIEYFVNGKVEECTQVVSSLPAKKLALLIRDQYSELADELDAIPSVTVGVINLEFCKSALSTKAFGFLTVPKEEICILGVLFDSCMSPEPLSTVLTVMVGGVWFKKYFGESPSKEHLTNIVVSQVKDILHIEKEPTAVNVVILKDCIPQHIVGHTQRLNRIRNYISAHGIPLALCGSSYEGVGVNDVILSAKRAVSNIMSNKK